MLHWTGRLRNGAYVVRPLAVIFGSGLAAASLLMGAALSWLAIGFGLVADDVLGLAVIISFSVISPVAFLIGAIRRHLPLVGLGAGSGLVTLFWWYWVFAVLFGPMD